MKDSPKQPDPGSLMSQQGQLNRINQVTPFGNLTYSGSQRVVVPGGQDTFAPKSVTVTLSPEQKRLMQQQQTAQRLLGTSGINLARDFPNNPMRAFNPGDFEASRAAAEQAVFQRGMSLLNPELERQEGALRQRLANQGLPQASRAFDAEMGRFERGRGEQMDRLAQSAVLQGLQAQQQGFGQALTSQQQNASQRAQQLQEILGLFGLQPVQLPQFANVPGVDVAVPGQQAQSASPLGGLLALGGAAAGGMMGGPAGAGLGFQMGAMTPSLFGY